MRILAGFGAGVRYGVHTASMKNLARAVVERVFNVQSNGGLTRAPQPTPGIFNLRLGKLRNRLLKFLPPTPIIAREDYPSLFTGRKQSIYKRALESLNQRAINFRDAYVSVFVKAEKVNLSKKEDPVPRAIQPRSPRYILELGRYLKKFEKQLVIGFKRLFGYAVILKGMNASEVGTAMKDNWDAFDDPAAVGLDASRFDQHVSVEALLFEHALYNAVFRSKRLAWLLRMQLKNRGIGRASGQRLDYTIDGCRMSGDINTGMGNCYLMSMIVIGYCETLGIKWRLANNGDDCVVFVERRDLPRLNGISKWFLDFGFTLTIEEPVFCLEQVVFCQAQPVLTSTGWRMTRDPRTAMSKDCVSLLGWDNEAQFSHWAYAIGTCGLALTLGVPVWEQWYRRLLRLGAENGGALDRVCDSGMGYMSRGVIGGKVDSQCRVSFYKAFGITPDLQEALELEYTFPVHIAPTCPMNFSQVRTLDSQNPLSAWLASQNSPL